MSTRRPEPFIATQAVTRECREDLPASFDDSLCAYAVELAIEHGAFATGQPAIRWTEITEANLEWAQAVTRAPVEPGDWVARVRVYCLRD